MNIKEQIETLIKLQRTSSAIAAMTTRLQGVDARIQKLDERLVALVNELNLLETDVEEYQKTYRQLEADAQMNSSHAAKSQETLRSVKTNKEYQSIIKEIDEIKKQNSRIEDEMLQCLEQIDVSKQTMAENQESYQQIELQVQTEKASIEEEASQDRKEMERLQGEWNEISRTADASILEQFEKVAQQSNGIAVVAVKASVCQGCYMNIPAQTYNELHRFDKLMFCQHCQRIIYLNEGE